MEAALLPISNPGWSIVVSFGVIISDMNELQKPKTAICAGIFSSISLKYFIIPTATRSVIAKMASISGCSTKTFFAFSYPSSKSVLLSHKYTSEGSYTILLSSSAFL